MTILLVALCFASACLGAVAGVLLLFKLAKPQAIVTLELNLRHDPVCRKCGEPLGTKTMFETLSKGTDTFPVTLRR